jgi:tellurite resistance protein
MPNPEKQPTFLEFLPVSLFGGIMGLTGLYFCWEWTEKTWGCSPIIKIPIGGLAIFLFIVLTVAYLLKIIKYPALVRSEFDNPVSISFFATFIVSLLLLPGIIRHYSEAAAVAVWWVGALFIFLFAWFVLRKWLDHQQDPASALPAWLLPVLGTLDAPIVGAHLPIPGIHEICLVFFAVGVLFAVVLMTVIISRLFFQPQLPDAIQPTLMILIAPSALVFSGYELLTGAQDIAASIFYYSDLFMFLLFASKIWLIPRCCPFRVTWWAVSFPLVAITLAAFRYAEHTPGVVFQVIPAILLAISTGTIAYLLFQTFHRIATNHFVLPAPAAEKATRALHPGV